MASGTPEEIKLDIEKTREALSRDLDQLTERVDPRAAAKRQISAAREQVDDLRHDTVYRVRQTVQSTLERVRKNPRQLGLVVAGAAAAVTLALGLPFVFRKPPPAVTVERRTRSDRRIGRERRVSARRSGIDRRITAKHPKHRVPVLAVAKRS